MVLLDLLAKVPDLTVAEISDLCQEPRSSIYRIIQTLARCGFVENGNTPKTYRLGTKMLLMGNSVSQRLSERQAALAPMKALHSQTGQTVSLFARRDTVAVCIERIDGQVVSSTLAEVGVQIPLYAGEARPLLAFSADESLERCLAGRRIVALTEKAPSTTRELRKALAATRADGYTVSDEESLLGISSLAAPVYNFRGKVCASLSLTGPRPMIMEGHLDSGVTLLLQATRDASEAMGYIYQGAASETSAKILSFRSA